MSISAPYSSPFAFALRVLLLIFIAVLCLACTAAFGQAPPPSGDYTHRSAFGAALEHLEGKYSLNNALDWIKQLESQ